MSILITGITGFVGKNLNEYLTEHTGADIIGLDLRQPFNAILPDTVTTVIHLAGKAHDIRKTASPDEYFVVNYELTKKLYDSFLTSNASQFIFFSSVKAAADVVVGELTETDVPNPVTAYGKSKLMAEEYITSIKLPPGKSYYILRPCMIHGPGNKGNLNLLYQLVKRGIPYPLAAFDNKRSFLSIRNLCFLLNEMITRGDLPSGIYNVADDQPLATTEVVRLLSGAGKSKGGKLLKVNPVFVKKLAQIGDVFHLPLNTERLTKLTENYVVSNKKVKQWLQKDFPLNSSEGITQTVNSFTKSN